MKTKRKKEKKSEKGKKHFFLFFFREREKGLLKIIRKPSNTYEKKAQINTESRHTQKKESHERHKR